MMMTFKVIMFMLFSSCLSVNDAIFYFFEIVISEILIGRMMIDVFNGYVRKSFCQA